MLASELLSTVQAALAEQTDWTIYFAYDPTLFDNRADHFLVLGMDALETQTPFLTAEHLCYAFRGKLWIAMLTPSETDAYTLSTLFQEEVSTGLLNCGYAIQDLTFGAASYAKQFQKMQLRADFSIHGVYLIEREAASL